MAAPQVKEFVIRVPKKKDLQRYSVLKFNSSDNVDTTKWNETEVRLERADNKGVVLSSEVVQEFGEGTEYGAAARQEARRKKYGRMARSYQLDNQPWHLSITNKDSKERRFNSIREGEGHSDNWVFLKNGEEFHAYKVDATHRFIPAITHKTLDIDQAEEKFLERNKVMNQFALKAQIQSQAKAGDEDGEISDIKASKNLKIKDGYSSDESENEGEAGQEEDVKPKVKKGKKNAKPKKDKRQRVENGDEVAKYESSDGEDEGREYDYMSDSGSDSDREDVKAEDKAEKELVGVGDEAGLKKMMGSDEESSSDEDDLEKKLLNRDDSKKNENADIEERDSSGSDSDDPDKEKMDSVVFLQKKDVAESSKKRPAVSAPEPNEAKRVKQEESNAPEGLNEETVRKYLRRKPHTTKELLAKINAKCTNLSKQEIVNKLACILKAIEPHQFKQKQGKKEVLFFSLTNSLA